MPSALREIIALMENRFPEVYFPVEVRVVAADDILAEPFLQAAELFDRHPSRRHGRSVAVLQRGRADLPQAWRAAALGQDAHLTASDLSAIYPRWNDAMAMRREMDPQNRFVSPYMARLLGIEL